MDVQNINLFFLREGYYECIVTTKDEISKKYDRKITVTLEKAQVWRKGTYVGGLGSVKIDDYKLKTYNDDKFYYIDASKWLYDQSYKIYMAIDKDLTDGKEYETTCLDRTLNGSSYMIFLFPLE